MTRKIVTRKRKAETTQPVEITAESDPVLFYAEQLELVQKLYKSYEKKDPMTLSPREREEYRKALDLTRYARAALESDRPLEIKLAELNFQLSR